MDIATPVDRHRIFDDPWCPLYGKIPDVLKGSGDKLTDQCVRVIEESRKIWTSASVAEDKLKIAKELWDLFRIHHNLVSNGHTRIKSITTESICETIIAETKKLSLSCLGGITDTEILAIYTIHVVFSTLKDLWEPLDKMEIDNTLYYLYSSPLPDRDSYVNAKIYIARLLLSQAKKTGTQTQKNTIDKIIPFPTPSGAKWSELKISFLDEENVSITIKTITKRVNYAEMGFKDKRTSKPNKSWKVLLGFALTCGQLNKYDTKEKGKIEKSIQRLEEALIKYFNIGGDPIPYIEEPEYKGYRTDFIIEDKSHTREYEDSIRKMYQTRYPKEDERKEDNEGDNDNDSANPFNHEDD